VFLSSRPWSWSRVVLRPNLPVLVLVIVLNCQVLVLVLTLTVLVLVFDLVLVLVLVLLLNKTETLLISTVRSQPQSCDYLVIYKLWTDTKTHSRAYRIVQCSLGPSNSTKTKYTSIKCRHKIFADFSYANLWGHIVPDLWLVFLKWNRHFFYLDDYKVESLATSTAQLVQRPMSIQSHSTL